MASSLWTPSAGQRPTAAEWKDRVADRVTIACESSTRPPSPVDGNGAGTYAVADAVFLPSTTTATLMTSAFAYTPNTGHSVLEIYGWLSYRAA